MVGDIGIMIAVYIVFKAVAEFARMDEVPSKGGFHAIGRLLVVLLGLAVIAMAVAGIMDIAEQGMKATAASLSPDSSRGSYAPGVDAGDGRVPIGGRSSFPRDPARTADPTFPADPRWAAPKERRR